MLAMSKAPRVVLHLRVLPDLKHQVEEFATATGLSINASGVLLLHMGLAAANDPGASNSNTER